jgi:acid phosphatase (class B)
MKPNRLLLPATLALACATAQRVDARAPAGTGPAAEAGAAPSQPRCPAATPRTLTVARYLEQLPPAPITVGLDVDDTALFSTPAFLHARARLAPPAPVPTGTLEEQRTAWDAWNREVDAELKRITTAKPEALSPADRARWARFWADVNGAGDAYSPPKAAARALVRRHLERGDRVVFVTARPSTPGATLERKLRADFGSVAIEVEFTALGSKVDVLKRRGVSVYYGDADGDMTDARDAGAWSIRFRRSAYSSNPAPTDIGKKDECFVLDDSDL